jgi:hypothetical protein
MTTNIKSLTGKLLLAGGLALGGLGFAAGTAGIAQASGPSPSAPPPPPPPPPGVFQTPGATQAPPGYGVPHYSSPAPH